MFVTERGFSFGYNNLVVDMRAFPMLRELGLSGGLRCHAQPSAAGRRRWRDRRARPSTSSRSRRPASPPASTACSWKSTKIRRARRATRRTRCALDRLEPLLRELDAHRRDVRATGLASASQESAQ